MSHLALTASTLVSVLLPIFALIGVGRLLVRFRFVEPAGTRGLTSVIFWVLLPALLFLSVTGNAAPAGFATVGLYFAVALPVYGVSIGAGLLLMRMRIAQAAVFGLNAAYGNLVMLGVPIVGAVWGGAGLTVLLSIVAAHSLLLLPVATVLVDLDRDRGGRHVARLLGDAVGASLKNPIVASIVAAALWRAAGLALPEGLRRSLDLLAQAAPALSLICLGASLPPLQRGGLRLPVLLAVAIKLAIMPLVMATVVLLARIPAPASSVMILAAAMPTGANAFLLAHRSGEMMEDSAATVVLATAFSLVTLTAILVVFP